MKCRECDGKGKKLLGLLRCRKCDGSGQEPDPKVKSAMPRPLRNSDEAFSTSPRHGWTPIPLRKEDRESK